MRCPIHLYTGTEDAPVSERGQTEWRRETSGDFVVRRFPGRHYFAQEVEGPFPASVSGVLRELT